MEGREMTTCKMIDVAELNELLEVCLRVGALRDEHLAYNAQRVRDQLREALDKLTGVIDELTDWAD